MFQLEIDVHSHVALSLAIHLTRLSHIIKASGLSIPLASIKLLCLKKTFNDIANLQTKRNNGCFCSCFPGIKSLAIC